MSSHYSHSQFDIQNLEIYKEDNYNKNNNQEKINYNIYKSKSNNFDTFKENRINTDRVDNNIETSSLDNIIINNSSEEYLIPQKSTKDNNSSVETASITSSNITTSSDKFKEAKKSRRGDFFSFYDIIDPFMCFQSCYNHALLVNNVYPKAGEEGAKTNNLSFLMFYAKSRPQKLIKVGNYLEKKAKRDIWNSRPDLVKVTLTILDSLINTCPQHMNLISKNAINIFYEILVSNLDLLTEVTNTFMNFSSKHDHITLDIDESFHTKYLQVLEQFCKCCTFEGQNEKKRNETRLNGLKAIHSVVSSNSFLISPRIDSYLIIIQPLVENILISKPDSKTNISNAEEARAHTLVKSNVSNEVLELENYALKSISEIMQKVTPATFEKIITPIYSFINDKDQWSHLHYLTKILKIAMDSIQNQYRYLLITSLFKRLNDTDTNNYDIKIQTNIIFVLTFVITSNERSIGLTCLELLDNLTKHLLISLKNKNNSKEDVDIFQSAVVDCIGSLARNIYYPEQTNDMLSFLVNRLCFDGNDEDDEEKVSLTEKKNINTISNTSIKNLSEYLDEDDIIKYRIVIFHCLGRIIDNRKVSDSNTSINQTPLGIPVELLIPTVKFLLTDSIDQKIEYFNFMSSILPYLSTTNSKNGLAYLNMIKKEYHLIIYDYINKESLQIIDYILIYNILVVNLNQFLVEEAVVAIPLIDKLQKEIVKENSSIEEIVVFHTILLNYFENVASLLKNESLKQYADELKTERKNNNHYVELDYDIKNIYNYKDKYFSDLGIDSNASPIKETELIDHEKINEYTNFDVKLYKQYPELEGKLKDIQYTEFIEILMANQNISKANSMSLLENKHNRLANISIPELDPKDEEVLDNEILNDHKLDDFNIEGYSNNNILSNEVNNLLSEIAQVNIHHSFSKSESEASGTFDVSPLSPTKSVNTQSTGEATMVNISPIKSNFSPVSEKIKNKDLFVIGESDSNLLQVEPIQQQGVAYPKMEMNMGNLMIPHMDNKRPTSIYVKEPSLR